MQSKVKKLKELAIDDKRFLDDGKKKYDVNTVMIE